MFSRESDPESESTYLFFLSKVESKKKENEQMEQQAAKIGEALGHQRDGVGMGNGQSSSAQGGHPASGGPPGGHPASGPVLWNGTYNYP